MIEMTKQEYFNAAWNGMVAQSFSQSKQDSGDCAYRGENGLKCAIGHIIPDYEYDHRMEGGNVAGIGLFEERLLGFLGDMQEAHDFSTGPNDMKKRFVRIAADHNLTIPAQP